jgi:glycine cleavage system H protein
VGEVEIPSDLRYTADHEWVRITGGLVRVGITDYAQDALGDVVFIQLPTVGATVVAKEGFGEIESTKSVSDVYAPVSGLVTAVNEALAATPELLNSDPYGEGWICEIESTSVDDAALLSAEQYRELTGAG